MTQLPSDPAPHPGLAQRAAAILADVTARVAIPEDKRQVALSPNQVQHLLELLLAYDAGGDRPLSTLEIGLGWGYSAAAILASGRVGRHLVLSWDWIPERIAQARDNAAAWAGPGRDLEIIEAESQLVLPRLVTEGGRYDLILIDGGHRFDDVMIDVSYAWRLLPPGGLMVLDDLWMPAIKTACSWLEANLGGVLTHVPGGPRNARVYRRTDAPDQRRWDHFAPFRVYSTTDFDLA